MLRNWRSRCTVVALLLTTVLAALTSCPVQADIPLIGGAAVFSFDDGGAGTTLAGDALGSKPGELYHTTGFTGLPDFLTWAGIQNLYFRGWAISAHTVDHPELPEITDREKDRQIGNARAVLMRRGYNPQSMAYPFGAYDPATVAITAKYHSSARTFHDYFGEGDRLNLWPFRDYHLLTYQVQETVPLDETLAAIRNAHERNGLVILTFHNIKESPSSDPEAYEYSVSKLRQIIAYVESLGMPILTVSQALQMAGPNLLSVQPLEAKTGIKKVADVRTANRKDWSTDDALAVSFHSSLSISAAHGCVPTPLTTIQLKAGKVDRHLVSPWVPVEPNATYGIKYWLKTTAVKSLGVNLFIAEYNASGIWQNTVWVAESSEVNAETIPIVYHPSSSAVAFARLEYLLPANSGVLAYMDFPRWHKRQ